MIEEAARFRVERCDKGHIFRAQLEVEDVEVFRHSFLVYRFRDGDDAALGQPAQNHLSDGFSMFLSDCD